MADQYLAEKLGRPTERVSQAGTSAKWSHAISFDKSSL